MTEDPFSRRLSEYPQDILQKLEVDFGEGAGTAREAINEHDLAHPIGDRCMRCILYLADGDLQKLEEALKLHGFDERDLILQAEYEWLGPIAGGFASEHGKQVRDFSLPFEEGCQ